MSPHGNVRKSSGGVIHRSTQSRPDIMSVDRSNDTAPPLEKSSIAAGVSALMPYELALAAVIRWPAHM